LNVSLDHDDPHYTSKLIIEQLRDACVQASISLINKRSFREKILLELQLREIRETSTTEEMCHAQISAFLESTRAQMEEEITLLRQEEERYLQESNQFMAIILSQQQEPQTPNVSRHPSHTPSNMKKMLTPSQIAEQKEQTDLENMLHRLESCTPKSSKKKDIDDIQLEDVRLVIF
jgi:hypothetical protein